MTSKPQKNPKVLLNSQSLKLLLQGGHSVSVTKSDELNTEYLIESIVREEVGSGADVAMKNRINKALDLKRKKRKKRKHLFRSFVTNADLTAVTSNLSIHNNLYDYADRLQLPRLDVELFEKFYPNFKVQANELKDKFNSAKQQLLGDDWKAGPDDLKLLLEYINISQEENDDLYMNLTEKFKSSTGNTSEESNDNASTNIKPVEDSLRSLVMFRQMVQLIGQKNGCTESWQDLYFDYCKQLENAPQPVTSYATTLKSFFPNATNILSSLEEDEDNNRVDRLEDDTAHFNQTSLTNTSSTGLLPPLKTKLQASTTTIHSIKQKKNTLKRSGFDDSFSRPTPSVLQKSVGTVDKAADLLALRRELENSSLGLSELNKLVDNNIAWVQSNVEISKFSMHLSTRTKRKCRQMATERITNVYQKWLNKTYFYALHKWKLVCYYQSFSERGRKFCKAKAVHGFIKMFTNNYVKKVFNRWAYWLKFVRLRIQMEREAACVEIQRIIRGKLAKMRIHKIKLGKAATVVQSLFRKVHAYHVIQDKRVLRTQFQTSLAAKAIQKLFKSLCEIRKAKREAQRRRERKAAVKIQKINRGKQGRERYRQFLKKKLLEDEEKARKKAEEDRLRAEEEERRRLKEAADKAAAEKAAAEKAAAKQAAAEKKAAEKAAAEKAKEMQSSDTTVKDSLVYDLEGIASKAEKPKSPKRPDSRSKSSERSGRKSPERKASPQTVRRGDDHAPSTANTSTNNSKTSSRKASPSPSAVSAANKKTNLVKVAVTAKHSPPKPIESADPNASSNRPLSAPAVSSASSKLPPKTSYKYEKTSEEFISTTQKDELSSKGSQNKGFKEDLDESPTGFDTPERLDSRANITAGTTLPTGAKEENVRVLADNKSSSSENGPSEIPVTVSASVPLDNSLPTILPNDPKIDISTASEISSDNHQKTIHLESTVIDTKEEFPEKDDPVAPTSPTSPTTEHAAAPTNPADEEPTAPTNLIDPSSLIAAEVSNQPSRPPSASALAPAPAMSIKTSSGDKLSSSSRPLSASKSPSAAVSNAVSPRVPITATEPAIAINEETSKKATSTDKETKALSKSELKRKEAEEKKRLAEEKKREAEEKKREAEEKKRQAEEKKREAEEKKREAEELKRKEAEEKKREAEELKKAKALAAEEQKRLKALAVQEAKQAKDAKSKSGKQPSSSEKEKEKSSSRPVSASLSASATSPSAVDSLPQATDTAPTAVQAPQKYPETPQIRVSAIRIQCLIRKFLSRRRVKARREKVQRAQAQAATRILWALVTIQRVGRGMTGRRKCAGKRKAHLDELRRARELENANVRADSDPFPALSDADSAGAGSQPSAKSSGGTRPSSTAGGRSSASSPTPRTPSSPPKPSRPQSQGALQSSPSQMFMSPIDEERLSEIDQKLKQLQELERRIRESEENVKMEAKRSEERMEQQMKLLEEKMRKAEDDRRNQEELMRLAVGNLSHRSSAQDTGGRGGGAMGTGRRPPSTGRMPSSAFNTTHSSSSAPPTARSVKFGIPADAPRLTYSGNEWVQLWDYDESAYYWWCDKLQLAQWEQPGMELGGGRGYPSPGTPLREADESGYESAGGAMTDYSTDNDNNYFEDDSFHGQHDGWQEYWDEQAHAKYWYNNYTGEASWTMPDSLQFGSGSSVVSGNSSALIVQPGASADNAHGGGDAKAAAMVAKGWVSYLDESTGQMYWHNVHTGEVQWDY